MRLLKFLLKNITSFAAILSKVEKNYSVVPLGN